MTFVTPQELFKLLPVFFVGKTIDERIHARIDKHKNIKPFMNGTTNFSDPERTENVNGL